MDIVRYNKTKHEALLDNLTSSRELGQQWGRGLPKGTFCAIEKDVMVGMMCVREIEGGMGIIESAVTLPTEDKEKRNLIMDLLTNIVVKEAQERKFIGLLFVSEDKNTIMRGVKHGGSILPHAVVSRYL